MSMLVTMDFGNSRAKAALFLINHEGASLKEEFDASNLESVLKSSAEKLSSNIKISGSFTNALAIDNLCF